MSQVEDAVLPDARVLVGGARVAGPGRFYPPTVLTDVAPDSDLVSTEIFGPPGLENGRSTDAGRRVWGMTAASARTP